MSKYQASIFNDVLGPVMTGPSSSHTAGPGRIGRFIGMLADDIKNITIEFPETGSYAGTYRGQKSDVAFVAGILGFSITDPDFGKSLTIAKNRGVSVEILIGERQIAHPNTCFITIENSCKKICVESRSTGGGMFEIKSINGAPVFCAGDCHEIIIMDKRGENRLHGYASSVIERENLCFKDELNSSTNGIINFTDKSNSSANGISNFKLKTAPPRELLDSLKKNADESGGEIRYIPPLLPVARRGEISVPFSTSGEMAEFIKADDMPFWKAAVLYEHIRGGWGEERVLEFAQNLIEVMRRSVLSGLRSDFDASGFLPPSARSIRSAMETGRLIDTGVIGNAALYSTAVMEYNNAMGIIVACPTAGSCGVIPGVLFGIAGMDESDTLICAKALLCAGLIGAFIANQATFAAEVCGCQAENGAASCMASAVASFFLESDINKTLNAASMAMQNMLGLICDLVAGQTNIPCITRNAMAASNAIVSANLAAGGFDPVIPLDEVIAAMSEVGRMLPRELRCTGLGGLCATPTGQAVTKRVYGDDTHAR